MRFPAVSPRKNSPQLCAIHDPRGSHLFEKFGIEQESQDGEKTLSKARDLHTLPPLYPALLSALPCQHVAAHTIRLETSGAGLLGAHPGHELLKSLEQLEKLGKVVAKRRCSRDISVVSVSVVFSWVLGVWFGCRWFG